MKWSAEMLSMGWILINGSCDWEAGSILFSYSGTTGNKSVATLDEGN